MKRRNKVLPGYDEMYIQTVPYQFGKYSKRKYELFIGSVPVYSFVTTCRSTEDCLLVLNELGGKLITKNSRSFTVYITENNVRTRLKQFGLDYFRKMNLNEGQGVLSA